MKSFAKIIVILFVIVYVLSPADACPGPVDDLIVALLALTCIND